MKQVYIVKQLWWYDGPSDNYENCYKEDVLKVFEFEDRAKTYIKEQITAKFEYERDNSIVGEEDFELALNELLSKVDNVESGEDIKYWSDDYETFAYLYDEWDVE